MDDRPAHTTADPTAASGAADTNDKTAGKKVRDANLIYSRVCLIVFALFALAWIYAFVFGG